MVRPLHADRPTAWAAAARSLGVVLAVLLALAPVEAPAQVSTVYPDDSPAATDGLSRAIELAASGNRAEAARVIQTILTGESERVIASASDSDLFISVRARAHEILLSDPRLLDTYRSAEEGAARRDLEAGAERTAQRTRLLTRAGLEASLRVAQEYLEAGRFEAARLTLEELERHPDRASPRPGEEAGARDAAALALQLARYLPREPVRAWAQGWARQAGLAGVGGRAPVAGSPIELPRAAPPVTPLREIPSLEAQGLMERPLQSVWLSAEAEAEAELARLQDRRSRLAVPSEDAWTYPTVSGDAVYTNDGRCVAAWDRFTLQPLWKLVTRAPDESADSLTPGALLAPGRPVPNRARNGRFNTSGVDDADTVAVAGSVVVACTGLTGRDGRDGDGRIHAIDARTGRPMWSVSPGLQDPALAQAFVRGTVLIDGDTVVCALRKPSNNRRVAGAFLAGLDLWTGELRWARLLGSAGWVYQRGQRAGGVPVADRGVIYATDDLGVVCALRAHDGGVIWVRRIPTEGFNRFDQSPAWSGGGPVLDGDSLIVVSPNRTAVMRLSLADGEILGSRPAGELGDPAYLVPIGRSLAGVSADSSSPTITLAPLASFETGLVRRVAIPQQSRFRGRAVAAQTAEGVRLLVPLADGAAIVDPERPDDVRIIPLESSGNIVAVDSHLLVADRAKLHSYLSWAVAEQLLRARMEADPDDPRPALTFVALAYRSGNAAEVPPAADHAMRAIARSADPSAAESRRALFESLLFMVQSTQERWDAEPGSPLDADASGRAPPISDLGVLDAIVARVGRIAESPPERVQHLMALGRLRDAQALAAAGPVALETAARAVEAYHTVLDDVDLAAETWQGPGSATRADIEAARRARDLVRRYGRVVCRAFDARAAEELAQLSGEVADTDRLEALARRYPASPASLDAWLLAAEAHEPASRLPRAVAALAAGLAGSEWAADAGDPAAPRIGEFAGRLIRMLQRRDQPSAAAQLLDRLSRVRPGLRLTVRGIELDARIVAGELQRSLVSLDRRPRLGRTFSGEVQVIEGWTLMRPIMLEARATEHVIMISAEHREIALFGAPGAGPLVPLWKRPFRGQPPQLVAADAESVLLFWPSDEGGEIENIAAVGGATRWKTPQFGEMFPPDDAEPLRARVINTPVEGVKRAHDMKLALDAQTLVLATHSGRLAAFDRKTGEPIWKLTSVISQIYDMDLGSGVGAGVGLSTLLVGGAAERLGAPGEGPGAEPGIAAYDARTGRMLHHMKTTGGEFRWIRPGPGGEVIAGFEMKIASLNLAAGKANWEITDSIAAHTSTAWVFGDRLLVVDPGTGRRLWSASASSGARREEVLEPGQGFDERSTRAVVLGDPRTAPVAFCTPRGLAVFNAAGEPVGRDPWDLKFEILTPEVAEGLFVAVETTRSGTDSGPAVTVHLLESPGGRAVGSRDVVLHDDPRDVALMDGRVVISTEAVTVVLGLPVGQ